MNIVRLAAEPPTPRTVAPRSTSPAAAAIIVALPTTAKRKGERSSIPRETRSASSRM